MKEMGADNSRMFSPTEDEDLYSHSYRRTYSVRRKATTTTIDVGFAIRASSPKAPESGLLKDISDGETRGTVG